MPAPSSPREVRRSTWLGVGAVVLLLALVFWLTARLGRDRTPGAVPEEPADSTARTTGPSPRSAPRLPDGAVTEAVPGVATPGDDPVAQVYGNADSVRRLMALYKKANRYGPTTLRLTGEMTDVLVPNQFHPVTPHFVRARELAEGTPDPEEEQLYYRFWTDRFATLGDETLTLRFSAWQGVDPRRPAAVELQGLEVFGVTAGGDRSMGTLRFAETSPSNFDLGQYQVTFAPGALKKVQEHGYLRCVLQFRFPGEEPVRADVVVHHTQSVPGRFTGEFGEQLSDGGLVIKAGVEVVTAGTFNLSLLLFNQDGTQPVAYVNNTFELEAGARGVDFVFHGLVFHDAGIPGPYRVTAVRGYRLDATGSGRGAQLADWNGSWLTGPHTLSEFTKDEFTSPTTEATLEAYRKQIEELERGQGR